MLKKNSFLFVLFVNLLNFNTALCKSQLLELSLSDAIHISQERSIESYIAQSTFRINQLEYTNFRYSMMPNLSLSLAPGNYSRSIQEQWNNNTESYEFAEVNRLSSSGNLSLSKNIRLTGGTLSVNSNIYRNQSFGNSNYIGYNLQAFSISYSQSIGKVNQIKLQDKIQQLIFEEAKKNFLEGKEQLAIKTSQYFFDLLFAQLNNNIAGLNKNIADSLYQLGFTKKSIGGITDYDLQVLELKKTIAGIELIKIQSQKKEADYNLLAILDMPEDSEIMCLVPNSIASALVNFEYARNLAYSNNPDLFSFNRKILEVDNSIKQAKSSKYDIYFSANVGYNKNSQEINSLFNKMDQMQSMNISVNIPILDWGEQKRNVKITETNKEIVNYQIKESYKEIDKKLFKLVEEYNMQQKIIETSSRSNDIARKTYEFVVKRFDLGKASILEISEAYRDMKYSQNSYIEALKNYWIYYYSLRAICMYDFINDVRL